MDEEEAILREISESLADITIDLTSVSMLKVQGFMNKAYAVDSSLGEAVLHVVKHPVPEQVRQKIPEKIYAISEFFKDDSTIPTARVLAHGYLKESGYYFLQTRCPGIALGSQELLNNEIVRTYAVKNAEEFTKQTELLLAQVHKKSPCSQFGHLTTNKEGLLTALYPTWREFITTESTRWMSELQGAKEKDERYNEAILTAEKNVMRILKKFSHVFDWDYPRFVHGDMINPGNILVHNDKVSALLDFEWSVSGDPAWEFAFTAEFPSEVYYNVTTESVDSFEERKRIYRVFWLLWGANVHVHNKDLFFRDWLIQKSNEASKQLLS